MIGNPWIILVVSLAFVANGFYWDHNGSSRTKKEYELQLKNNENEARIKKETEEKMWQSVINGTVKNHETREKTINGKLNDAIDQLRNRPERVVYLPGDSRTSCEGGTGAELSRPDAEFLEREAARAEKIRGGLKDCYDLLDTFTK